MALWFFLTVGTAALIVFLRMKRPEGEETGGSNMIMFFHVTRGEGDLFLGGCLILFFFSRFILSFFQSVTVVF